MTGPIVTVMPEAVLASISVSMNPPDMMVVSASDAGNGNGGKEVSGAWMLMVEVSVQDPAAPSWEFLQVFCCTSLVLFSMSLHWPQHMHISVRHQFHAICKELLVGCSFLALLYMGCLASLHGSSATDFKIFVHLFADTLHTHKCHCHTKECCTMAVLWRSLLPCYAGSMEELAAAEHHRGSRHRR